MAPPASNLAVPLQKAIWSRTQHATCKLTPFNKALADALWRAQYISWLTESGAHAPDASLIAQFSPEELRTMHVAHTASRHKRQLWMGLAYRGDDWKAAHGWWLDKKVPVAKTVLTKSLRQSAEPLRWSADEVGRLVKGQPLGEDMWRRGLAEGQGVFLQIEQEKKAGSTAHAWNKVEVLESREAAERGVGGLVVCRVWPYRKRVATDRKDNAEFDEVEGLEEAALQQKESESKQQQRESRYHREARRSSRTSPRPEVEESSPE